MQVVFQKKFLFSSSHSQNNKIVAHNYVLMVSVANVADEAQAQAISQKIQSSLIDKIHSRDLGLHVDFLKNRDLSGSGLLNTFHPIIEKEIRPHTVKALTLEMDQRTSWTLEK